MKFDIKEITAVFVTYVTFIANMDLGNYLLASSILIRNFISFINNFIH